MGLLDGLLGSLTGGTNNSGAANPLLQIAMQMLANKGGGGTDGGALESMGGLHGIVNAFQQGGLGHLADSWIGTGENLPVSADQLSSVLGSNKIGEIASQLGMSPSEAAGGLAKILPDLINHITPNGQMPGSHSVVEDALSMFLKR
ncbi:MAG: YidB family protein [Betaproteobacteria bacterium]